MNPTDCSGSKLGHFLVCVGAVLLSAGCAGVSMPAFPPAPVVAYEGARWPDADAVVIEEERELVYRRADAADGERLVAVMSHRVRLVVLTEGGLGRARVELPVDDYSSVVGVQARSVAKGGREVWLDSIDLTPRTEDGLPLEAGQVGAVRFKVPGVKIGSVIDYQYMRVFSEPDLVPVLVYGRDLPVLRSEISVIKPRDVRVDYRSGREGVVEDYSPVRIAFRDGRDKLIFVRKDLPAYFPEPGMPHLAWTSPWLQVTVAGARVGERLYRLESWDHVQERVSFFGERVGELSLDGLTAADVYRDLQRRISVVDRPGVGVLAPRTTRALERGLPVSSRDAATILARALELRGLRAYPALLTSPVGPPAVRGLPSLAPFVRVVVAVDSHHGGGERPTCEGRLGDDPRCSVGAHGYLLVDPSCRHCRLGELPSKFRGGRALVLRPSATSWIETGVALPRENWSRAHYELKVNERGELDGEMSAQLTGMSAMTVRTQALARGSSGDMTPVVRGHLMGNQRGPFLNELALREVGSPGKPLSFSGKVTVRSVRTHFDHLSIRQQDLIGPVMATSYRGLRKYPRLLSGPARWDTSFGLTVPAGYGVLLAQPVEDDTEFMHYVWGCKFEERRLECTRRLTLKRQGIHEGEWAAFVRQLDRIKANDARQFDIHRLTDADLQAIR